MLVAPNYNLFLLLLLLLFLLLLLLLTTLAPLHVLGLLDGKVVGRKVDNWSIGRSRDDLVLDTPSWLINGINVLLSLDNQTPVLFDHFDTITLLASLDGYSASLTETIVDL